MVFSAVIKQRSSIVWRELRKEKPSLPGKKKGSGRGTVDEASSARGGEEARYVSDAEK